MLCPFFINLNFFIMANIKLGAIITDIAGSVSGSTFRRTPAGIILYNKQGTQIKSAFARYSQKNQISAIFRNWAVLSNDEKIAWANNALLYPVTNKFGQIKYLTGRQLYTKLNSQLLPMGVVSDVLEFDTYVEGRNVILTSFNKNDQELRLDWDGSGGKQYLLVSVYQVRQGGNPKPHAHFRRIITDDLGGGAGVNYWTEFNDAFPLAQAGQWYGFNIQWLNASGISTAVQSFSAEYE